jgi:hypothetical protein
MGWFETCGNSDLTMMTCRSIQLRRVLAAQAIRRLRGRWKNRANKLMDSMIIAAIQRLMPCGEWPVCLPRPWDLRAFKKIRPDY